MNDRSKNQGEGDREAARRYNEAAHRTAEQLTDRDFATAANLSPDEQKKLRAAEAKGKARAKGEDPAIAGGTKTDE